MEEGLIEHNPMANVKKLKLPNRTVKGLDTEVVRKLMDEVNGRDVSALRNKAMLYMFLDTGLRLSELANLKLSDIDMDKGIIKTIGKGNKERYARIGVKMQKALWNYLTVRPVDTEHVWQGKDNCQMTKDGIAQMVRKLGKEAGYEVIAT